MLNQSRPYTFDRVIRILISCAIIVGIFWLLNRLSDALLPFFIACLLAYIFEPFVAFNKKIFRLKNNIVPIILFLIEMTAAIFLIGLLVIPIILNEMATVCKLIADYATSNKDSYMPFFDRFIRDYIDVDFISGLLSPDQWYELVKTTLSGTWTVVSSSISVIMYICGWFIVLIYFIFILLDYNSFMKGMKDLIPEKYKQPVLSVLSDVKASMNKYFRGQALIAFCVGILFCIGFLIIDMPMAIVLGLFIGLLNMVPYLQLISIVPTTMLCLIYSAETGTSFWHIFILAMVVYAVVQIIQDMYLTPKIMGKAMGLNPAVLLLSLSIWGSLLGFLGLIIALPLTTLVLSYYQRYVLKPGTTTSNPDSTTPTPSQP